MPFHETATNNVAKASNWITIERMRDQANRKSLAERERDAAERRRLESLEAADTRPAWMRTHVIDPAWVKSAVSTYPAPLPNPITVMQSHIDKLLPIVFDAKRLVTSAKVTPRKTEIDGHTYAFSGDVDNWIDGWEHFASAIIDTLHQAGFEPRGAAAHPSEQKVRDAIGGVEANRVNPQFIIDPAKLLTHMVDGVKAITETHLAAVQSVIGDVLKSDNCETDLSAYAEEQYRDGSWSLSVDVAAATLNDTDPDVMSRIRQATDCGLNPCAYLTAAEVRAEDVYRERQGLGPLALS